MSEHEPLGPTVLEALKSFQRDTAKYAFERLYGDGHVYRFLVADEVGLGKTLVARGLIAMVIDHLREQARMEGRRPRIDIVYICSSADIAQQNVAKLNVTGGKVFSRATRLTRLAEDLHHLKDGEVNLVSLTPGTSFSVGDGTGQKEERALLYWLLVDAWWSKGRRLRHAGIFRLLQAGAKESSWPAFVEGYGRRDVGGGEDGIDRDVADAFRDHLCVRDHADEAAGRPTLRERFEATAERLRRTSRPEDRAEANRLVGELRRILARSSVEALEPDLIILDEFQRFRHLLEDADDGDETRLLAKALFDFENTDGRARTLLLSATPYKMYTLAAEADRDDHFGDFVKVTGFLLGEESGAFRRELAAYRESILALDSSSDESHDRWKKTLLRRRTAVEARLKRVMTRTEKLGATNDRSGMLRTRDLAPGAITAADARTYLTFAEVARQLDSTDAVEYWKSAPYPLSFMDGYDVKRKLRDAATDPTRSAALAPAIARGDGLLDPGALEAYAELDPGNARLRTLAADTIDAGAWRLLWLPPALPYYETLGSAFADPALRSFTKRLVFSSWNVVPQAVASVLSYEAERRMIRSRDPRATTAERGKMRSLLLFRLVGGARAGDGGPRAGAMSVLGLISPSPALARRTDPLELAAVLRRRGAPVTAADVLGLARERVERELRPFRRNWSADTPVDEAWYWAAPILLERRADPEALAAFWGRSPDRVARAWVPEDEAKREEAARGEMAGLLAHIALARVAITADWLPAGRMPEDLAEVVALLGVAGPANAALRALARGDDHDRDLGHPAIRDAACRVAWGFRSLFGLPEVQAMVRGRRGGAETSYWRRILDYCLEGNVQAMLDEYGHVLPDWLGRLGERPVARAAAVADGMHAALTLRAPTYGYEELRSTGTGIAPPQKHRLRARFALRFGVNLRDEDGAVERATQVRAAFNSPFWPFVLVTTSVGQEGLDFHQYCHAIVHWNLPSNPVDFEQREGRVHRYKGHAVRRNVADDHRSAALAGRSRDPWAVLFDRAARSPKARGQQDIVPYWIYEGAHHIERHVPMLPMSREVEQFRRLQDTLALYRLVFGQPRQEEATAWLRRRMAIRAAGPAQDGDRTDLQNILRIDLSPPRARRPR